MHTCDNSCFTCFLPDATATERLGQQLAASLQPGLVIYLTGNLGAGKTALVRSMLQALGVAGHIKSPTYTLVEPYTVSSLYLYHFDLYRFANPEEWDDLGFREFFNAESICFVEWAEKAAEILPQPDWQIRLEPQGSGRQLQLQAYGEKGQACLSRLQTS